MVWTPEERNDDELEDVDKILLRNILDAPSTSCVESLYLELGLIPIHIILKSRRIVYYHYLVNLNNDEMLILMSPRKSGIKSSVESSDKKNEKVLEFPESARIAKKIFFTKIPPPLL